MLDRRWMGAILFFAVLLLSVPALAGEDGEEQLSDLSLEELMDVEVVTASRRSEPLSQVAGAVTVLNEEDIFRSGATSLPEVLKLVPGVHVARVDTDKWAVGIRGFNGMLSNKHLVLMDGRPMTLSSTGGVFWDDMIPVSMIKRIEVVRGVWTSLWGSDSFTGVINIITKKAEEARGGQSVTTAGSTGVDQVVRYGGEIGEDAHGVGYGDVSYKTGNWLTSEGPDKSSRNWTQERAGGRIDWTNAFTDSLSLQGDWSHSEVMYGASDTDMARQRDQNKQYSGYGQFTWDRATGLDSGYKLRTSYTRRVQTVGDFDMGTNVVDAEWQHAVEQLSIHRITWGAGSRYFWDDFSSGNGMRVAPPTHHLTVANAFAQDRLTLAEDSDYLTFGLKMDYLGSRVELQPTVRYLHSGENQEIWAAVSRAVRMGNVFQEDGSFAVNNHGVMYTVIKPKDLEAESLISYEAGYRRTLSDAVRLDVDFYVNDYENLIAFDVDDAARTATLRNTLEGTAYGMEALIDYTVNPWLRLRPSASLIYQDLYGFAPLATGESLPEEGLGSEVKLEIMTTPTDTVGVDLFVAYLDSPDQHQLPGYFSLEGHISWKATDSLMLELIGRNLDGGHKQFSRLSVGPSVDLRMTLDF